MQSTEEIIKACVEHFGAPRGETTIFVGGRRIVVHTPGEQAFRLSNGVTVKCTTDDSGHATQIEEDDALHAIARPDTASVPLPWARALRGVYPHVQHGRR